MDNARHPLSPNTKVTTTEPNMALRKEWSKEGWESREWGVEGTIITHHDSHGLCYEVRHADGTVGWYDPTELELSVRPQLAADIAESRS